MEEPTRVLERGLFIAIDAIVGVWDPNYGVVCLFLLHTSFQGEIVF